MPVQNYFQCTSDSYVERIQEVVDYCLIRSEELGQGSTSVYHYHCEKEKFVCNDMQVGILSYQHRIAYI